MGQPLRAAGRARGSGVRARRRRARLGAHAHLSELRLLLPPGLGPAAARRPGADVHGLRRADPASALRRARRACWARVFGESADRALVLVCLLSHALLVLGTYRLGAEVFGRWSGRAGGAVRGRERVVPAVRGARLRRRPVPRAGGVGGRARGVRPRAVGAARARGPAAPRGVGADRAWPGRAGAVGRASAPASPLVATLAVIAAPAIWALTDWAVTGDPLHSLNATSELADELGRVRGLEHVPGSFVTFVSDTVRLPVALLAVPGLVLAWRVLGLAALRVPLALFAAGVITFVGTGALGLSILPRYLTVPAVALCLFAGYALLGFTALERDASLAAALAAGLGGRDGGRRDRPDHPRAVADQRARGGPLHPRDPRQPDRAARRPGGPRRDGSAGRSPSRPTGSSPTRAGTSRTRRSARARRDGATAASRSSRSARRRCAATASPPAPRRRSICPATGFTPLARHGLLSAFSRC